MVIQHNLPGIGACRQAKIISFGKTKTSEHLASGYRINRAADDAAGLSISQKMRAQIRGLDRANKNIEEGINFVQVGEGGMQEVHDILQRMRELVVQAANGTNEIGDRRAIQDEIDALSDEINSIAYKTSFNGHRMLCGIDPKIPGGGSAGISSGTKGLGTILSAELSDVLARRATYGGSKDDIMGQVICNPDGTIAFAGTTSSSDKDLDGAGTAANSGWVTKVGTDGEIIWTTKISGAGGGCLAATADGGYLTAGGATLAKLDADGNVTWTYRFKGSVGQSSVNNAFAMQDGSGNVFLSIQTFDNDNIHDGNGNPLGGNKLATWSSRDTIMMVIDPSVNPNDDYNAFEKKAYRIGGNGNEQIAQITATSDGGYIGGNYTTSTQLPIVQSDNKGNVKNPPQTVIGNAHHEAFIVKFNKNGDAEKVLLYGDSIPGGWGDEGENISQIIEIAGGGYLVVGTAALTDTVGKVPPKMGGHGGKDIWVLKLDKDLNPIWGRTYGSSENDAGYCAVETEKGYVIAGSVGKIDKNVTPKPGYSGASAWVFMIDKEKGDIIWDEVHGGEGDDSFNFAFADENGDILLAGNSNSTTQDLEGKYKEMKDAWFLKLNGETGKTVKPSDGSMGGSIDSESMPEKLNRPSIYLQVGAGSRDLFQIDYADMRTKAVFGDEAAVNVMNFNTNITTEIVETTTNELDEATGRLKKKQITRYRDLAVERTLELCDKAIDYVSRQRIRYGSYQNALEHRYKSNAITSENETAAESRIADADMAAEMVEFSRDKILEQANIAMMAQANMANADVLYLLQS